MQANARLFNPEAQTAQVRTKDPYRRVERLGSSYSKSHTKIEDSTEKAESRGYQAVSVVLGQTKRKKKGTAKDRSPTSLEGLSGPRKLPGGETELKVSLEDRKMGMGVVCTQDFGGGGA